MIIKGLEAERFVAKPPAAVSGVLVYGANYGLGQEYIHNIVRALGASATELSAAACLADPAQLHDAAGSQSLFGDKTVVWVRDAGDKFTDLCAEATSGENKNFIVVEAGELGSKSRLRKLFEEAPNLVAMPCYVEKGAELERTITDMLGAENISISRDAAHYLADRAPADRLALRGEIERLVLYVGAGNKVDLPAAQAALGDAADADIFELPWAVFDGKVAEADTALTRLEGEGTSGIAILRLLLGHTLKLHAVQSHTANGMGMGEAIKTLRPPLFYNQTGRFQNQLKRWNLGRLTQAVTRLHETELQCKSTGYPGDTLVRQLTMLMAAQP